MSSKQLQLWIEWIFANTVGLTVSGFLALWLLSPSTQTALNARLGAPGGSISCLLAILAWPLGSAVAQWLLLQTYLRSLEKSWLLATLVGGLVVPAAILLGFLIGIMTGDSFAKVAVVIAWGIAGVTAGSAVGVTQAGVLHKALKSDTALWVLVNAAGWGVGWLMAALLGQLANGLITAWLPVGANFTVDTLPFSLIIGHIGSAALTGLGLVYILRPMLEES